MKNLNRYKDIFSPKEKLTVEDINRYNSSTGKERNRIEQKEMANNFDQEAMDGWESVGYDTSILSNRKNPFSSRNKSIFYIIGGAIVIGLITSLFFIQPEVTTKVENSVTKRKIEKQKIILESNDVFIPEQIEQLTEQPIEEQVTVQKMKNDFQKIEEINVSLPIQSPHQIEHQSNSNIALSKQRAKELYLNDLKTIDYSKYRTASFIETKQFVLTGVPADLENEKSEDYDTEWKTIDQAYSIYLENTMYYFNQEAYKKALTRFEIILKKYPKDVNANFYAGLCFYNFGEYERAISHFNNCLKSEFNNFDEEAQWMIANSHENSGASDKAQEIFAKIERNGGFYAKQAKEKLKNYN